MHLIITIELSLLFSCCLWEVETRKVVSTLSVRNGGIWGHWGKKEFCHEGYIEGFSLKLPETSGGPIDDTGVIGIRGHCSDGSLVTSTVGEGGTWSKPLFCRFGNLDRFALRVTEPQGPLGDDTSVNNIKFACPDKSVLEGNGPAWGTYGEWSKPCLEYEMCGIQTMVEDPIGLHVLDRTELNDVKFFCCE
ncbi:vitelline membrane outer layer protein 1-like [Paroedura picta]|uniref:vitelline membrane outer layer protein 1-like n=1 Tax=Paroedura picta TaxID=143630 RepID=UPI004055FA52